MARRALGRATWAVVQAVEALPGDAWLVGCSGGADSLALAWAAHHVATRRGTPVRALVVDHGLQEGSDAVAAQVVATVAGVGLAAAVATVRVAADGPGPEASARAARYAAFEDAVRPGERVLLGHTLDDQAETVLLGLSRGSGLGSLAGIPPERGPYLRPLLGLGREITTAACGELGLEPWRDPHNADVAFARVRVRELVLPVVEAHLGPGIREALARTATQAREAHALLAERADATEASLVTDCHYLLGLAPGLRHRLLHDWLRTTTASDLQAVHVEAVDRLVTHWRGQRGVDVPGGRVVRRDGRLEWVAVGTPPRPPAR